MGTRTGAGGGTGGGFAPPPYPYERLNGAKARATERFAERGGLVDCSIGTPCDAPPDAVLAAMATSGTERGYPTSPGSPAYRRAAADWLQRRFGVTVDVEGGVAACVGTKEFVATTAQFLRLRTPDRDTVVYPSVSYPTYAMGATLAGARAVPVPELGGGGLDLDAVDPADAERALLEQRRLQVKLQDAKNQAVWDVNKAWSGVQQSRDQLDAVQKLVALARQVLEMQEEKSTLA